MKGFAISRACKRFLADRIFGKPELFWRWPSRPLLSREDEPVFKPSFPANMIDCRDAPEMIQRYRPKFPLNGIDPGDFT